MGRSWWHTGRATNASGAGLADRHDRFADEARPEQRRLAEVPGRADFVQVHADEVRAQRADQLLHLEGREAERLRVSDRGGVRGIHSVHVDRQIDLVSADRLERPLGPGRRARIMVTVNVALGRPKPSMAFRYSAPDEANPREHTIHTPDVAGARATPPGVTPA